MTGRGVPATTRVGTDPRTEIEEIVARYRSLGKKARAYNEARTVNEFIMPLFGALGWDVRNSRTPDEVVPEEKVSQGRVDWAFRLKSIPRFYLEAKRPAVNLDDPKPAKQAIDYSYNKGVTWAVLTNFEGVRVYNAEWDSPNPNLNLFFEIKWEDYPSDGRLLWLSREAMQSGVLDAEAEKVGKRLRKTPVGEKLFADLLTFRNMLRTYFSAYNSHLAAADIDHAVQRLLDRLIFIRASEDRRVEEYHLRPLLRELADAKRMSRLWGELLKLFRDFDTGYDSQLFVHQLLDELEIEPEPIRATIAGLYGTPNGAIEYDFSAIDADVLGGVYEQYLGQLAKAPAIPKSKLSVAEAIKQTEQTDTRPFRKAQGVYYTPTWVTRLIVEHTVGRALAEWSADDIRQIRVLDPACGSGSFLIEAFRRLADYWEKAEPPKSDEEARAQRVRILHENIFGNDLDSQAVEIAQLNLLLVALSDRSLLPDLAPNIVVGNSLVDTGRGDAFNFAAAFPFADRPGEFDVVIGNPPYIRSQLLGEADRSYYKGRYKTAQGSFDTYQLFLERALELTKGGGRIGFIVPGKFLSSSSGESHLLGHIYSVANIEVLVDAMRFQVFGDALTYPVIIIAHKGDEPAGHRLGRVTELTAKGADIQWSDEPEPVAPTLAEEPVPPGWTTVGSLARVSQALVTGADNVFALRGARLPTVSRLLSDSLHKAFEIETALLRPLISGSREVHRFGHEPPKEWLLFPYRDGKLIPEAEMKADYPLAWAYLEANRERLEQRDNGEMKGPGWYGYSRTQNLTAIWKPKAIVPYMSVTARAAADAAGEIAIVNVTTGGYFVAPESPELLPYLTAALNSKFAETWWKAKATPHAGGYFGLTARAIKLLPIPDPAKLPAAVLAEASTPKDEEDDPFGRALADMLPKSAETAEAAPVVKTARRRR